MVAEMTVTYLEIREPRKFKPKRCDDSRFRIEEARVPQWQLNRYLYQLVGGPWAWKDKLKWRDEDWQQYVEGGRLRTIVASYDATPAGYYELRTHDDGSVEIAYFGIIERYFGRGYGAALLSHAIETCWTNGPCRVWVNTCDLDHPNALANYEARGMERYKSESRPVMHSLIAMPAEHGFFMSDN